MGLLDGKVAVITGGAKGQGRAEARLFVNEGAKVVIGDVDEPNGAALADELGGDARFVRHDISSADDWQRAVDIARAEFGGVDILINNAGIWDSGGIEQVSEAEMRRLFDVNLFGSFLGLKAVIAPMEERGGGAIVNIASAGGLRGHPGVFGYGVSKWAMRGLSRYAAVDLVGKNIRVNAILSGMIATDLIMRGDASEMCERARQNVPMKRIGEPEEVAGIALFLASDQSSYMTGAEIVVDGGMNA